MNGRCAIENRGRRFFLQSSAKLLIGASVIAGKLHAAVAGELTGELAAILQSAAQAEILAYQRYVSFARKAHAEDYDGISYLFTALATSELIHAQNYNRSLTKMGADIVLPRNPDIEISNTKRNTISMQMISLR